jgi:hypothetical protein
MDYNTSIILSNQTIMGSLTGSGYFPESRRKLTSSVIGGYPKEVGWS